MRGPRMVSRLHRFLGPRLPLAVRGLSFSGPQSHLTDHCICIFGVAPQPFCSLHGLFIPHTVFEHLGSLLPLLDH